MTDHIDPEVLTHAVTRAREHVLSRQGPNGAWVGTANVGPHYTAIPLVALAYAGITLPKEDVDALVRTLRAEQREDGSYAPYPGATTGDPCATAVVWTGLRAAGLPAHDVTVARAFSFVAENGGLEAVAHAFFAETNFAALFVMMGGHIPASQVPLPPPRFILSAPAQKWMTGRYDYLNLVLSLVTFGAVVEERREKARRAPDPRRSWRDRLIDTVATVGTALTRRDDETIAFLERWQNPNGALDDTSLQTAMLVAAYHALGVPRDDPRMERAVTFLRSMIVREADGSAWFSCFTGDVWGTGFAVPTLLALGVSPDDPAIDHAVSFLLDAQVNDESCVRCPMKEGAPKAGGWPFEGTNVTVPDCDDTGIALAALGSLRRARVDPNDGGPVLERAFEERSAIQRGTAWLEGMQMPDGGWSAFEWADRKKPRGPLLSAPVGLDLDRWIGTLEHAISPPSSIGGPAWEDISARVLLGLGLVGYDLDRPAVWRVREFLRAQQLDHGGWWGRWMVNYLPTTAFVLQGLAAVGDPLTEPWIRRGVDFLLEHQNFDGGWGETEESYAKPELAGTGPSMTPLTGIVVNALVRIGMARSRAVTRGVKFLIDRQRADGSFSNDGYLHAFFPPKSFYRLSLTAMLHPAEALGAYRQAMIETKRDEISEHLSA